MQEEDEREIECARDRGKDWSDHTTYNILFTGISFMWSVCVSMCVWSVCVRGKGKRVAAASQTT